MAETNLGRVQGGGFFYSSASENTVVNKSTLTPNNIPALLGDHILFNTGKVYKITKVDNTNVNCVYETSIKGPQGPKGDKGDMPDVSNKADKTYVDTELDKKQDKQPRMLSNINLDDYHGADKIGNYFGVGGNNCTGKPEGYTPGSAFSLTVSRSAGSIYTQVFTYADNSSTYKREYKSNTWSEWRKFIFEQTLPNPNLLINPNFKINQRGDTTYTGSKYYVDRWRGISTGIFTATYNANGGIKVNVDKTDSREIVFLTQPIEQKFNGEVGKKLTLSLNISSIKGNTFAVLIRYGKSDNGFNGGTKLSLKQGYNAITGTIPTNTYTVAINFITKNAPAGDNITIDWVKLEYGDIATKFEEPEPITELAKCKRYYQVLTSLQTIGATVSNDYARVYIPLQTSMYRSPTLVTDITGKKITFESKQVDITSIEIYTYNNVEVICSLKLGTGGVWGRPCNIVLNKITLDAEL